MSEDEKELEEDEGPPITLIATKPGAFRDFYDRVKERIFKPAAMALPSADELRKRMREGLQDKTEE